MVNPLVYWVPTLLILVALGVNGIRGRAIQLVLLGGLFLFAQAVINVQQGGFYTGMVALIGLQLVVGLFALKNKGVELFGSQHTGVAAFFVVLVVGVGLTFALRSLSGSSDAGSVIGVPQTLAVSSGFINDLQPTLTSSLGYIENIFFLNMIPVGLFLLAFFKPLAVISAALFNIFPVMFAAAGFAIFHLAVFNVGGLIFAFVWFVVWGLMASYGMAQATHVSHYTHNGLETLPLGVSV